MEISRHDPREHVTFLRRRTEAGRAREGDDGDAASPSLVVRLDLHRTAHSLRESLSIQQTRIGALAT